MKKALLAISIFIIFLTKSWACGGWDYYDRYSPIFSQELINDERYLPFLWDPYAAYYTDNRKTNIRNANIEEWQKYLNISYDNAYYLVFKASEDDIATLLEGKTIQTEELKFATPQFSAQYKDALEYLRTAKEMEPYMCISGAFEDNWNYYDGGTSQTVDELDYDLYTLQLQAAYKKAKDKEIKLRYGYQLVRLAHYKRNYNESIQFFDRYVEPLNLKSEIYYYALSQRAGAVRGTGNIIAANSLYFKVFANSSDLKEMALTSINFNENVDFERFMQSAQTLQEKNDADLLLGFISFSNPLACAEKIINRSPDAIQAKVLLTRALAEIEDGIINPLDLAWTDEKMTEYTDRRYPILKKNKQGFLQNTIRLVTRQTSNEQLKDKDFWYLAAAYLHYLNRNYTVAESNLNKVQSRDVRYQEQKQILALITDVGKETTITDEVECRLFGKYNSILTGETTEQGIGRATFFVNNILANRYYNQRNYAKSFMIHNTMNSLDVNPQMELLDEIEAFVKKENKNPYETYLTNNFKVGDSKDKTISVLDYIAYMKGIIYLTNDDLDLALEKFKASKYSDKTEWISTDVFGYNSIECFWCNDNMKTDYLNEFAYIGSLKKIDEKQLVEILQKLKKEVTNGGERGAKANYLLGNFFYNVTTTGYYRAFLRFGYFGLYRDCFFNKGQKNDIYNNLITMEDIPTYFENRVDIANNYLQKAYNSATNNELKARIAFALSKCEQEMHYQKFSDNYEGWSPKYDEDWVMISNRRYFAELMKYRNTKFFDEVYTNCKYFEYYVNQVAR